MRAALRGGLAVSLSVLVALLASACSSGGDDGAPPSGCTRTGASTTGPGPGDTLDYFPSAVGSAWTYQVQSGGSVTWTVNGTQVVGTETASLWSTGETIVERPSGVYVLSDASADPMTGQLYPLLVLPFPIATTAVLEQGRCTSVVIPDADGDGKPDVEDAVFTTQVLSITETVQVAVGSLADLVHVQQVASATLHLSALGKVPGTVTQDDWFAPGIGLVLRLLQVSTPYGGTSESMALVAFTPPVPLATVSAPTAMGRFAPASMLTVAPGAEPLAQAILAATR